MKKKEIPLALKELGWTFYGKGSNNAFISSDKRFLISVSGNFWVLQDNNKISLSKYYNEELLGKNDELRVLDGLRRIEETLKEERKIEEGKEKVGDYVFDKILEIEGRLDQMEQYIRNLRNAL